MWNSQVFTFSNILEDYGLGKLKFNIIYLPGHRVNGVLYAFMGSHNVSKKAAVWQFIGAC